MVDKYCWHRHLLTRYGQGLTGLYKPEASSICETVPPIVHVAKGTSNTIQISE